MTAEVELTAPRRTGVSPSISFCTLALLFHGSSLALANSAPAFSGAEGFGARSVGGRGGQVYEVTHLLDYGPGSLRACFEGSGPRTCVFRTGGTIHVQDKLSIDNPYITIAGQTAPGDGITLQNAPEYGGMTISIKTHDIIVRDIRVRPGSNPNDTGNVDAIGISSPKLDGAAYNIIIDHMSLSWGTDETVSVWNNSHDITIQSSIISEALHCSTHIDENPTETCHSMGMLLGSDGARNISVHHNLFAHNNARNPEINTDGIVDVVNNVIYNPGEQATWAPSHVKGEFTDQGPANYVGNYHKRGPSSGPAGYTVSLGDSAVVFVEGNLAPDRPTDDLQDSLVVRERDRERIASTRHAAPSITTTSAETALIDILADAGASRRLTETGQFIFHRDPVDLRVVNDVINGTGQIIDEPSQVGGWPSLAGGLAPSDMDHDGMPDAWETLFGFNINNPLDGPQDSDRDGYTNLEEFLNGTNAHDLFVNGDMDHDGDVDFDDIDEFVFGLNDAFAYAVMFDAIPAATGDMDDDGGLDFDDIPGFAVTIGEGSGAGAVLGVPEPQTLGQYCSAQDLRHE